MQGHAIFKIFLLTMTMSVMIAGCAGKTSADRSGGDAATDEGADAEISTATNTTPITGTNLISVAVVSSASGVYDIEGTTEKAERFILSNANAARFGVLEARWRIASGSANCQTAAKNKYRFMCKSPDGKPARISIAVEALTKANPNGLQSPTITVTVNPDGGTGGDPILFLILEKDAENFVGFKGRLISTSMGASAGTAGGDFICTQAMGTMAPRLGSYLWKALVIREEDRSWEERFTGGASPFPFSVTTSETTTHSTLTFNRDVKTILGNGGDLQFPLLVAAGNQFVDGLNRRTNEISLATTLAPLSSPLDLWFDTGCTNWTSDDPLGTLQGTTLRFVPKAFPNPAVVGNSACGTRLAIGCIGVKIP